MRPRFFESYLLCLEQCPIYTRRLSSRQRGPEQSYLSRGTGQSYPPNQRQDVMSACESLGLKDKVVLGRADYKAVGARSGNGWQFSRKVIRFRRRAPWKGNPNARPELSGTSWGDLSSRYNVLRRAGSRCLSVESRHLKGRCFGFRDHTDTSKAALDAHLDCLSTAPDGAAPH